MAKHKPPILGLMQREVVLRMLANVQQTTIKPVIIGAIAEGAPRGGGQGPASAILCGRTSLVYGFPDEASVRQDAVPSLGFGGPHPLLGNREAPELPSRWSGLGISASALSHALRGLEERVGVRLLNRTSRSVTLTAAGEELQAAISGPLDEIGRAVKVLNRFRDAPIGRIRLSVPTEAAELLVGPVLATFAGRYPDVELEISVSNRMIDVIDKGYLAVRA